MPIDDRAGQEQEIHQQRARVEATLDEIERRLTPGQLVDEVLRHVRDPGASFVANLGRTLAENPVPTALVGVGIAWLLLARRAGSSAPVPPAPGNADT